MENWQFIERLAPQASIAHHVTGRVRIKFDIGVLENRQLRGRLHDLQPEHLRHALENLHGVSGVRFNPLARSCTVEYDAGVIPRNAWEDLLACRKTPEAEKLAAALGEQYRALAGR